MECNVYTNIRYNCYSTWGQLKKNTPLSCKLLDISTDTVNLRNAAGESICNHSTNKFQKSWVSGVSGDFKSLFYK